MRSVLALLAFLVVSPAAGQSYAQREDVKAFIGEMVSRHDFVAAELGQFFSRARRSEGVLEAIKPLPPAERVWRDYRAQFVNDQRIAGGLAFWKSHRRTLERAERDYGVPAQYIVAIIGVETLYGRNTGRWRVADSLVTLAFDYPPRAAFFRGELENFLLLARENGLDLFSLRGSYAGAIGIPQFMPGSIRRWAVDYNGDGVIDLSRSATDAIGSVASFLRSHGWQSGGEVHAHVQATTGEEWKRFADGSVDPKHPLEELARAGVRPAAAPHADAFAALIDLGSELRLGYRNFYVLTRYNRSAFYASAVADLAEALREQRQRQAQSAGR